VSHGASVPTHVSKVSFELNESEVVVLFTEKTQCNVNLCVRLCNIKFPNIYLFVLPHHNLVLKCKKTYEG
jgi:hypothetical protein